jgi:putative solute:sodium symporter small subunit
MNDPDLAERQRRYWRRNLTLTAIILLVWFLVTFVASYFADDLNRWRIFGFPLGFYFAAQGALIVYGVTIWYYAHRMPQIGKECGLDEDD